MALQYIKFDFIEKLLKNNYNGHIKLQEVDRKWMERLVPAAGELLATAIAAGRFFKSYFFRPVFFCHF